MIKTTLSTLVCITLLSGCAGSQYNATSQTTNQPFNAGVGIGQAIGKALWGGE